jgi:hypothetical protein
LFRNLSAREKTGFLSYAQKVNLEDLIFALTILFIPSQLGKHFWPEFSFVSGVRVDYLSPTFYFTDILIILLFTVWFIKSSKSRALKHIKDSKKLLPGIFLFSIFLVANISFSENIPLSFYGLLKLGELIFFSTYTAFYLKRKKLKPAPLFSISVIIASLIAIFQYINQSSLGGIFYFLGERSFTSSTPGIANVSIDGELILRGYGTFSHPNVLAGFLLLTLTFILFKTNFKNNLAWINISAIILGSVSLFLTFSRLPILLWVVTLVIYFFSEVKIISGQKKYITALAFLAMLVSFFFYSPFYLRFLGSSFSEESYVVRVKLLEDGISKFYESPWIGSGIYNFLTDTSFSNTFIFQPVHNIFILILIQGGIIGLIFFTLLFCKIFSGLWEKMVYLKLIFLYIIFLGMFDHYFLTIQQGQLMFGFFVGYLFSKND